MLGDRAVTALELDGDDLPRFNPISRSYRLDPYAHYAELRARNPIHRAGGMVVVTRYADVRLGLTDPALSVGLIPAVIHSLAEGHPEVDAVRLCEFADKSIVFSEGPLHARLRSAAARCLTRSCIETWRASARGLARQVVSELNTEAPVDLVSDFAAALPLRLLGSLLGLTPEESASVVEAAHGIRTLLEPISASSHQLARGAASLARAEAIIGSAIRRDELSASRAPLLEMLMVLGQSEVQPDEIPLLACMVYVAGHDTTVALIASALQHFLLLTPEERAALVSADHLAPLVRETARLESPLQFTLRRCTAETDLGVKVYPGERVLLGLASANRDEAVFTSPERFDQERAQSPHLSFGIGLHGCLGNLLASMEAEEAIRAVADVLPDLTLIPGAHKWSRNSLLLRGLERLPAARSALAA